MKTKQEILEFMEQRARYLAELDKQETDHARTIELGEWTAVRALGWVVFTKEEYDQGAVEQFVYSFFPKVEA